MILNILWIFTLANCVASSGSSPPSLEDFYSSKCKDLSSKIASREWPCAIVKQRLKAVTKESLSDALESTSFKSTIHAKLSAEYFNYYVFLEIPSNLNYTLAYEHIDLFVQVNPWWIIRQYPTQKQSSVKMAEPKHIYWTHRKLLPHRTMILERVPSYVESISRGYLAQSFPVDCSNRTIFVKTSLGSWGNDIIVNMHSYLSHSMDDAHLMYTTYSGSVDDHVGNVDYDADPMCRYHINKHLCSFLPSSNCSVPTALKNCKGKRECILEGYYIPTANHKDHVRGAPTVPPHMQTQYFFTWPSESYKFTPSPLLRLKENIHLGIVAGNIDDSEKRQDLMNNERVFTGMFNLIYRPNYHLGLHIQSVLERFFDESPSVLSEKESSGALPVLHTMNRQWSCHAIHIRMGDRYINRSMNMFDCCREHTNASAPREERWIGKWTDGRPLTRSQWHNMGCNWRLPFGTLTLQPFVNASVALNPNISHLVVMSDDYYWLKEELKIFRAHGVYRDRIQFHLFPTEFEIVHGYRSTYQATAEWWAGIQAARQCDGFIGHIGSAASYSFFHAMCFQYRNTYWRCPPWFMFD